MKKDPDGMKEGAVRVLRNGSWGDNPRRARVADRGWQSSGGCNERLGLRLARTSATTSIERSFDEEES